MSEACSGNCACSLKRERERVRKREKIVCLIVGTLYKVISMTKTWFFKVCSYCKISN